ncbi:hypothetical protein IMZ11_14325 [Microtetraspora sp. AC03309]|nr:hypothetical protein [Microtetraspora sp. AC03309]MCC5576808.1 hypothetical protein [Microtetraspora sp. AC03309]
MSFVGAKIWTGSGADRASRASRASTVVVTQTPCVTTRGDITGHLF